jgi:hypothetical protein
VQSAIERLKFEAAEVDGLALMGLGINSAQSRWRGNLLHDQGANSRDLLRSPQIDFGWLAGVQLATCCSAAGVSEETGRHG